MGAGPRSREMQFVHLNGGKKRQTKNIKMYFFALARESRLSTDRSTAIFAHTLFCPIPSHLNSILKSWARTSAPLHGFWVHNFATSNTHTHTQMRRANSNLKRQLRFGFFSRYLRCLPEWKKMGENLWWWWSHSLADKVQSAKLSHAGGYHFGASGWWRGGEAILKLIRPE